MKAYDYIIPKNQENTLQKDISLNLYHKIKLSDISLINLLFAK